MVVPNPSTNRYENEWSYKHHAFCLWFIWEAGLWLHPECKQTCNQWCCCIFLAMQRLICIGVLHVWSCMYVVPVPCGYMVWEIWRSIVKHRPSYSRSLGKLICFRRVDMFLLYDGFLLASFLSVPVFFQWPNAKLWTCRHLTSSCSCDSPKCYFLTPNSLVTSSTTPANSVDSWGIFATGRRGFVTSSTRKENGKRRRRALCPRTRTHTCNIPWRTVFETSARPHVGHFNLKQLDC